jgi:two-component system, chemotaxis family, protein-glutamate methylesterase/glutaminase
LAKQNIVAIGASSGGIEALKIIASRLPVDLKAAVFVVVHIGPGIDGQSLLPQILTNEGPLPAIHPAEIEEIRCGRIYVARPDLHMILIDGHVRAVHGPKENRTRPAINPLFRSAATIHGPSVTGVILSGLQDDGVAGLAEIKRRGGVTVVQEPSSALFPTLPQNAIQHVQTDYVLPPEQIAEIVAKLAVTDRAVKIIEEPMERKLLESTCPECAGPFWEERQGSIVEYHCRVGHTYSPLTLKDENQDSVERSLWASVVALENAAVLSDRLVAVLGPDSAREAEHMRAQAQAIREMLNASKPTEK